MAQDTGGARSTQGSDGGDAAHTAGQEARETGREVMEAARETGQELKTQVQEKGQELKAQARQKKDEVLDKAEEQVDRQRHVMTEKVHAVAAALRTAGDDLDGRGEGQLGSLGRQAADQIERLAGYLDSNDVRGLVADLEGLARNNPGVFLGSTFASGLAAGRFLRSSEPEPERETGTPSETGRGFDDRTDARGGGTGAGYGSAGANFGSTGFGSAIRSDGLSTPDVDLAAGGTETGRMGAGRADPAEGSSSAYGAPTGDRTGEGRS